MIVYRLDRRNQHHEGQLIDFIQNPYPNHHLGLDFLSEHGLTYIKAMMATHYNNYGELISPIIENNFEVHRRNNFPDKPSRYQSVFAVKQLTDFHLWKEHFSIDRNSRIFEIDICDKLFFEADARHLINDSTASSIADDLRAYFAKINYWSGRFTDNPLPEIVIKLPVTIGKQVDLSELI